MSWVIVNLYYLVFQSLIIQIFELHLLMTNYFTS